MVWRTTKEEVDPQCTAPTVKYGGGSVKCWGCFSSSGVGNLVFIDGNMSGELYRDILPNDLLQSVKNLSMNKDWIFQHGNDPKHPATIVTNWLNLKHIECLKWPSFSPDMNPIEHLWNEVERRMKKDQPKNEKELKEALSRVWNGIEKRTLTKLVDSVPIRLNEALCMRGYPTRY